MIKALYLQQQPIEASPRACSWRPIRLLPLVDELQARTRVLWLSADTRRILYAQARRFGSSRARQSTRGPGSRARQTPDAKHGQARKYAPGRIDFANSTNLPSPFAYLLENVFCGFGKNSNLPSAYAKHLELLLHYKNYSSCNKWLQHYFL